VIQLSGNHEQVEKCRYEIQNIVKIQNQLMKNSSGQALTPLINEFKVSIINSLGDKISSEMGSLLD
jgi:uncharacterized membrane protein (DUF106 family)